MRKRRQAGVIRGKGLGHVRTDFKRPKHSSHSATAWRDVTSRQAAYQQNATASVFLVWRQAGAREPPGG